MIDPDKIDEFIQAFEDIGNQLKALGTGDSYNGPMGAVEFLAVKIHEGAALIADATTDLARANEEGAQAIATELHAIAEAISELSSSVEDHK